MRREVQLPATLREAIIETAETGVPWDVVVARYFPENERPRAASDRRINRKLNAMKTAYEVGRQRRERRRVHKLLDVTRGREVR